MGDRYLKRFAAYAAQLRYEDLPDATVHEVKRRVLDSIGVGIAAFTEALPKAARAWAYARPHPEGARLWGTPARAAPEVAAFANGVLVRYLDYNDTYLSREPLHPSDMLPALFAVAEWRRANGRAFLVAAALAYEVAVRLCDAASLRAHGWDHVNYITIGTALGASRLLGLEAAALEHALALAVVPHAAMRATRAGELSMWKGAAAAAAARGGVFAATLAAHGVTGPPQAFEGEMGFVQQLLGGAGFDEAAFAGLEAGHPPTAVLKTHLKRWPVEYHAQSAVEAALALHKALGDPQRIARVRIETFRTAYEIIAKDPEKWAPTTRETADHSLPYIVAVALLDGAVSRATFAPERIQDPRLRAFLAEKVTLEEAPELSRGYPEGVPHRITVHTTDGRMLTQEVRHPRGHAANPMSDAEVRAKYRANVQGMFSAAQAEAVEGMVWELEALGEVGALSARMVV
ncbi:MmgE/PrpD family protein [Marinithermus hydrothermalis]|uniref:2-methylcitrate dehydratase n=1 Tax=Marinithermus hydrothermalis (strain DSM 14884 / JCM 11576 / T1) TaxID=869210 RepID=F2NN85_MARHT|nr:MmgE/PrpD family protein [Marinithermus hydrothermalis]AEB10926.1 2-methylcitrate dehydratase [Marinithermus hydrothermalis DSM 14884]